MYFVGTSQIGLHFFVGSILYIKGGWGGGKCEVDPSTVHSPASPGPGLGGGGLEGPSSVGGPQPKRFVPAHGHIYLRRSSANMTLFKAIEIESKGSEGKKKSVARV